jgi:cytochrome bd-type quinol oxidase subunit 2
MRLLRLLSRVAFICNVCFVLTYGVSWLPNPPEGEVVSSIIVLGYFLAVIVNTLVNLCLIILLIFGRLKTNLIPLWLLIVNFIFFIIQFVIILFPLIKRSLQ